MSLRISWCRSAFIFSSKRSWSLILSSSRTLPWVLWAMTRWAITLLFCFCALRFTEPFKPFFGNFYIFPFSLRRLLLEAVQDIYHACDLLQVKHAIPRALVLVPQLIDSRTYRLHGLAVRGHLPELHPVQRIAQVLLRSSGKRPQNLPGIAKPNDLGEISSPGTRKLTDILLICIRLLRMTFHMSSLYKLIKCSDNYIAKETLNNLH